MKNKIVTLEKSALSKKVTVSGSYTFNFESGYNNGAITGSDKADTIKVAGKGLTVTGGRGNDTLTSSGKGNVFVYNAGDGNDVIKNFSASDVLSISGTAKVSTSSSDVVFTVGKGKITLTGAAEEAITYEDKNGKHDYLNGERAIVTNDETEVTVFSAFKDKTFDAADYGSKIVTIDASTVKHDLEIIGNSKANKILGGKGADIFVYYNGDGNDLITDYEQEDTIVIKDSTAQISSKRKDIILTIGKGKITLKGAADKSITYVDKNGEHNFSANVAWFLEDENNFSTDNQLSDLIETKTYLPAQIDFVDSFKENSFITYSDKK